MSDTATTESVLHRKQPKLNRKSPVLRLREAIVWEPVQNGWRQVYGGFYDLGVSIEWHDFELSKPFEWSRSFHPDSLELCLNLSGHGSIHCAEGAVDFEPVTTGFYLPGNNELRAWRRPGERHRFITVEFSPKFLRAQLAVCDGALHPLVEGVVRGDASRTRCGEIHRLTAAQEQRITHLLHPPVFQGGRRLWYQGKVLQIMAEFFFERRGEDELFCDRQKRLARERVEQVVALLRKHLAEPVSLEEIGCEVGCSPFHLSRTFSAEAGMTIPQYLRRLRMERAAELLQSGKYNVTEAALEVGYSSLSHFSQSFCRVMGRCPGLYPLKAPAKEAV
ncbi:MAG TPA: AraC family transcriptional regulator [Candidatus Binatia bacterium]|jgi:AraC family transcriptional regulator|nr:AraC family transcriptional regulator [Candidatus Binatia bacterium]